MPDEENEKADADKLKQRNRELAILNTVAKEMNRSVDLDRRCVSSTSGMSLGTCI